MNQTAEIIVGDSRVELKGLADNSIDSIVTDPPYELGFMGKGWDKSGIAYDPAIWTECLRVLKPGGHLLAFSSTRTYHRMACAIEDAGFEIRDQIGWLYGSGFPKSLDVSKAIDKAAGAERKVVGSKLGLPGYHLSGHSGGEAFGKGISSSTPETRLSSSQITAPSTDSAKQWNGWGTALKPAWEPIVLARKPLIGTVAENVLTHGVGGVNINGCRVEGIDPANAKRLGKNYGETTSTTFGQVQHAIVGGSLLGRWPANVIHDGSEEVLDEFAKYGESNGSRGRKQTPKQNTNALGNFNGTDSLVGHEDSGTPARFFYCAKASKTDRDEGLAEFPQCANTVVGALRDGGRESQPRKNNHPTVKPTALMRYLCRLVTPPGGIVLDPFTGSGSTGKAAIAEGLSFIGIELSEEYADIAAARINGVSELKEAA